MNIAIIGTYPPRQCGIATFTQDLFKSLLQEHAITASIVAISDGSEGGFSSDVSFVIEKNNIDSYQLAVKYINQTFDAIIIQHEYGIFGGHSGNYILDLAQLLSIPIITNFHTVLQSPTAEEHRILYELANYSHKVTVMTETAVDMLAQLYCIESEKIRLIPHGVPKFGLSQADAKTKLGLTDKKIMLSFGFLGPSKGFETAIDAVASVRQDNFLYIILGSTHPNILREAGESYRDYLQSKVDMLGITDKVCFVNEFASEELLTQYLSACDIYVTPYPNENQISSGTLSFAIGAGAAVVSTPYWYAKDLLKDERGLLFDFKDSQALAQIINSLLETPSLLAKYRQNALQYGISMSWSNIGKLQCELISNILGFEKPSLPLTFNLSSSSENISNLIQTSAHKLSS